MTGRILTYSENRQQQNKHIYVNLWSTHVTILTFDARDLNTSSY